MSSSPVISIENLSKYYRLGLIGGGTLREDVSRWLAKACGKPDPLLKIGESDHGNRKDGQIWALKDINLEVNKGEILGIIGRNGAGKSTLLKILSKITAPTEGRIRIKGRVGSLLEVGTGFHPELTGRENIYLNGAILGMTHAEVSSKLEEIVEFAEMSKFIDTPVKRYSSGMTVRLAFAVAAHLEPEILVVDEVLAVGDAAFQKKCLGKMKDIAGHGRTVLFVSHNLPAVENLCTRGVVLSSGCVDYIGSTKAALEHYLGLTDRLTTVNLEDRTDRDGNGLMKFSCIEFIDENGVVSSRLVNGKECRIRLYIIRYRDAPENAQVAVGINDSMGRRVVVLDSHLSGKTLMLGKESYCCVEVFIPKLTLNEGVYTVTLFSRLAGDIADWIREAAKLEVKSGDFFNTGQVPTSENGVFLMDHQVRMKC